MFVNYRLSDGNVILYGGYEGEGQHETKELAEKRLNSFLRSSIKNGDGIYTKDNTATAERSVWWKYKQQKNLELGKPVDAHY